MYVCIHYMYTYVYICVYILYIDVINDQNDHLLISNN